MSRRSSVFASVSLFALPILAGSTLAAEEPTGFAGIRFGASEAELKERHSDIGDVRESALYQLVGESGERRLMNVMVRFASESYGAVRTAFIDRYGQPSNRRREVVSNRMGATFDNEILVWAGKRTKRLAHALGVPVTELLE